MVALDFCLVVGTHGQSDEESNYGIKMGRFSMDTGQLSDQQPVEDIIAVYDNTRGIQLANATIRLTMVYNLEDHTALDAKKPSWDAINSSQIQQEISPVNPEVNLFADAGDKFTKRILSPNRQEHVFFAEKVYSAPSSARSRQSVNAKRLIPDADIPLRNSHPIPTAAAPVQQTIRKQLVLDVELPRQRRAQIVEGYLTSSSATSPPRIAHFKDEIASSPVADTAEQVLRSAEVLDSSDECPNLSGRSRQAAELVELANTELIPGRIESPANIESSPGSSPSRSRRRKKRALQERAGAQSRKAKTLHYDSSKGASGQIRVEKAGVGLPQQEPKTKTTFKPPKIPKPGGKGLSESEVISDSSHEKSSRVRKKSPGPSTKILKVNAAPGPKTPPRFKDGTSLKRPETRGKPKTYSKRSRPRAEEEKVSSSMYDLHASFEAEKNFGCDLVQGQRNLNPLDLHRLSGNLAILPEDMVGRYLEGTLADREEDDSSLYQASLQKLIEQIAAFRATLVNSSVKALAERPKPPATTSDRTASTKNKNLISSFKELDNNVGSISRLLMSLLARSDLDDPQYARVAQTELLEDDPSDVLQAALVEELLLAEREKESSTAPSKPEIKSAGEGKPCDVHTEGDSKAPVFVDGLPLRHFEGEHKAPKNDTREPVRDSLCIHGVTEKQRDHSPTFNLHLTLSVGKLLLPESKPGHFRQHGGRLSTCLLTISFPGINHCKAAGSSAPEQSIAISPTLADGGELYFGNESQLNWKNVNRQSLEIWKARRISARALLTWDSGQSLVYQGDILLEEVFTSMPKVFQTKLVLVKGRLENEAAEFATTQADGASATLELAINLLVADSSGKALTGAWLYVTISSITGSKLQPDDQDTSGHLALIVKSDVRSICRIPFYSDWSSSPGNEVKAWRPLKGSHPDGVLQGPKQIESPTLFIEVWRKGTPPLTGNPENLLGLVKVPVKSPKDITKADEEEAVVAEGEYYIWNPYKDVLCGTVEVRILMGSEVQMLRLLQQNRAARIIQSHASGPRDGKQNSSSLVEYNPIKNRNLLTDDKMKMVKHVIEVTVQYATDLPETSALTNCEGTFIKYLFPCDEEAFYTQTMAWRKTIHFSACVHHGIIFPVGQRLDDYFMTQIAATDGDLIFELWGCYSSLSDEETYSPNKLRPSDNGALSAWDMEREPTCKHEDSDSEERERLIGTAKLPYRSLLGLVAAKIHSSSEVRKKFFLTIQLESSLISGAYTRTPTLAVEVSYSTLNREELNHHLRNTIFSNVKISEDSLLEGVVEFDILGAAGLQEAKEIFDLSTTNYFTTGVNSYARYSLFDQNKEFASRYPPCSTTIQPNSSSPQYNWRGSYKVDLNVEVLKELKTGYMSVEVWHQQFPQATRNVKPLVPSKDRTTDLWLGTALIPTRLLVESRQGIEGWYDLISRKGQKVGTINVEVYFKHWKVRPLEFSTTQPHRRFHE
ncbi:hypothetical protein R1sor_010894 [Riccia sorocarpa]|uniref:C2 domain-containing protein n=1 Tax=Riccia sorocarpa TaxID=122646 RepID=A0ABD3HZN8_9MARC